MADFIVPSTNAERRLQGPIHSKRHVRVICIGAGASGLLLAYKLQRYSSNFSMTVYEKNPEVVGESVSGVRWLVF
jgi:ribulose 1,5-bisphosphate synthetase/thiazole synthase